VCGEREREGGREGGGEGGRERGGEGGRKEGRERELTSSICLPYRATFAGERPLLLREYFMVHSEVDVD
jgi:hypothetical protein